MVRNEYYPLEEQDVKKLLRSGTHCGEITVNSNMKSFIFLHRTDNHYCIDLMKTWNHLQLAARILCGIENPKDIYAVSGSPTSHRAVLKFALYTKCSSFAGKFTPGCLTNQAQTHFKEPRIIVVSDPLIDHQVVIEAACMGIPVIALCNTNCPLNYIDIVIPCNNKGVWSVGVMWWMLAREVLRLRGVVSRNKPWNIMVDMFFQREQALEAKESTANKNVKVQPQAEDQILEDLSRGRNQEEQSNPPIDCQSVPDIDHWTMIRPL
uniref:Small ribosomal subunit protein uS2 n=1 Tax=Henneguya salminicola TaxID=69463 RepID=A0A6G3ME94_HENSL